MCVHMKACADRIFMKKTVKQLNLLKGMGQL